MVDARIQQHHGEGLNAFLSDQIPSAIISLKQGSGRLIRNRDDRGVLSLLEDLLTRSYGQQFLGTPYPITRKVLRHQSNLLPTEIPSSSKSALSCTPFFMLLKAACIPGCACAAKLSRSASKAATV